jgi:hypothetical protein
MKIVNLCIALRKVGQDAAEKATLEKISFNQRLCGVDQRRRIVAFHFFSWEVNLAY